MDQADREEGRPGPQPQDGLEVDQRGQEEDRQGEPGSASTLLAALALVPGDEIWATVKATDVTVSPA